MKEQKIMIDGVEITSEIAEVLSEWYGRSNPEDIIPIMYSNWLGKVQDYLTRVWVDKDEDAEDMSALKECVDMTIQIKDSFSRLIPKKGGES